MRLHRFSLGCEGRRRAVGLAAVGCTVALLSALTACGSGSGGGQQGSTSPSGTAASTAGGLTNVSVGANLNVGTLGTYVAIDKGFFAKHGLNVKLTNVLNLTLIPSQLGHQFDFGQSVQPITINAADSGLPVVVTAGGEVESSNPVDGAVIVLKSSHITSAKDLDGKRVAVLTATGNNAFALKYWMKEQGADPSTLKLTVVAPNNMLSELKAGAVDAMYGVSPFSAQALADPATVKIADPQLHLGGAAVSQGAITISNRDWAESHKQVVLEFEEAQADAIAWIKANPAQALAILDKYTGSKNAPGTKLPPITATENLDDLNVWYKVMKSVVPGFSPKVTAKDLIFQPIDAIDYQPQP